VSDRAWTAFGLLLGLKAVMTVAAVVVLL